MKYLAIIVGGLSMKEFFIALGIFIGVILVIGTFLYLISEEREYKKFIKANNGKDDFGDTE